MKKDDNLSKDQTDEEEIFDLSLDDLSESDINIASNNEEPDEEIIELMELVEKGDKDLKSSDEEATLAYDEDDQLTREIKADRKAPLEEAPLSETDMVLANISLESDISLLQGDEEDKAGKAEDLDEDEVEEMLEEETDQSLNKTIHKPIVSPQAPRLSKKTDPEKAEAMREIKAPTRAPVKEISTVSEEKIEAIIKKVMEDVMERVARDTMAKVAERVIKETIDSLKQSLEKD
jgi:hypothetical protein